MSSNIVHVVGTGTIGEPLIGLLASHREEFGIDEVTFFKRTLRAEDRPKLTQLQRRGAQLVVDASHRKEFEQAGYDVADDAHRAIERATVVIDCTPSGCGLQNKAQLYEKYRDKVRGFVAQGSEFGFGKMYARHINDTALDPETDQFLQVVSCNTHNISALIKTLGDDGHGRLRIDEGRFTCLRRANDISQDSSFVPAPQVGKHSDAYFGTHHARDAYHLFQTLGHELHLFSSAVKLNTQYMHALHFAIRVPFGIDKQEALARLTENPHVALSEKRSANTIFSFGREHGHYGRILNQTVVSTPTLTVRDNREVLGFCFTPQDGNSLVSSIAATLWFLDPQTVDARMGTLAPYLFAEV